MDRQSVAAKVGKRKLAMHVKKKSNPTGDSFGQTKAEGMAREATAACGYGVKVIPKRAPITVN